MKKEVLLKTKRMVKAKIASKHLKVRLSVYKSSKKIYGQIIDDQRAKTLVAVHEKELGKGKGSGKKSTKLEKARLLGELIAKKALGKKIKAVIFDRNGYRYLGRIKAFAEGARKGGLEF